MRERVGSRSPRKEQRGAFQISSASTSSGAPSTSARVHILAFHSLTNFETKHHRMAS